MSPVVKNSLGPLTLTLVRTAEAPQRRPDVLNEPILEKKTPEIDPLSPSRFIQLPPEISLEVLLLLPVEDLLRLRHTCTSYKTFIDNTPELQSRISYYFIQKVKPECHILLEELRVDLTCNKLSVEVGNDLCLWKLTHKTDSMPQLNITIPWISHLTIKGGEPNQLTTLFKQLLESNRLTTLCLLDCKIDLETWELLKSLQNSSHDDKNIPVFYFCNLHTAGFELPAELSTLSPNIITIEPSKAFEYSMERFLTQESDWIAVKEFGQQVQNDSLPGEVVLKKWQELKPILRAGIIHSIWYSKLMPLAGEDLPTSERLIQKQVKAFIAEDPHHPAVRAAAQKNLEKFMQTGL
jgi:hypothetical protein